MSRSKPLRRRTPLTRNVNIRRRNEGRAKERKSRNFGYEADAVRAMPCLACKRSAPQMSDSTTSRSVAAHVVPRGMGGANGGRFDLVPLCPKHHADAGEERTSRRAGFEARHKLDLRYEADRIALEHANPLGLRGLAERWITRCACGHEWAGRPDGCDCIASKTAALDDHERAALFGWARRRMTAYIEGAKGIEAGWDRADMGEWISEDLEVDNATALAICDAAGWPNSEVHHATE